VLQKFGLERAYYSFSVKPWRFIVLDGMDVSIKGGWPEDSPNHKAAVRLLEELHRTKARNAHEWNGAVGAQQRAWLARELRVAERNRERAVVFCHFPTLPASCRPDHLLWDYAQVTQVLESSPAVAAYINGHDHNGGYAEQNGIHYVTLPGMVENDPQSCVRVCDAVPGKLVLRRPGERDGQVLPIRTVEGVRA
jgi:3',5'-cyclic AMP phosphodiesterase CpdA